jgi:hypothetical protein
LADTDGVLASALPKSGKHSNRAKLPATFKFNTALDMKNLAIIPALLLALAVNLTAQEVENPTFGQFVAQFQQASLPYSLDAQAVAAKPAAKAARLDWQFYQFLPELEQIAQSSNMPVHPEPVAAFETKENIAVLYNLTRGANRSHSSTYTLSVFDRAGNHIATHIVAGANSKSVTTAIITASLKAEITALPLIEEGLDSQEPSARQLDLLTPTAADQMTAVSAKTTSFGFGKN